MLKFIPVIAQASIRLFATLLPSPIQARVSHFNLPFCSYIVNKSAKAWQGCSKSESAFITGTEEYSASTSKLCWAKVRKTIPSTNLLNTLATSGIDSRLPNPTSSGDRQMVCPPNWRIATSKLTLVLKEGFSNRIASVLFLSIEIQPRDFSSMAESSSSCSSVGVRSLIERKCFGFTPILPISKSILYEGFIFKKSALLLHLELL